MRKMAFLLVFAVIVTVITTLVAPEVRAQDRKSLIPQKPLSEEKVPLFVGGGYGSYGLGFNLGLTFPNAIKVPGLFIAGEFCQNAQLGFMVGCQPLYLIPGSDKFFVTTAIEWQYEVTIITTDFHPTNQTFSGEERMFLSLRIGPSFEVGRFGIGVYWNVGQTWLPSSNPSVQDWRWSQTVFGHIYFKL
jgi:hypothetical protein